MRKIKWKQLFFTCAICLLPIVFGVILWDKLPQTIAIHFNIYNEPDGFASKAFAVIGLPIWMAVLQAFACVANDLSAKMCEERIRFERIIKWILPVICILLQAATFAFALGIAVDIRRVACLIVGAIFLILGKYLPKLSYIKNYNIDTQKARKINRFIGYESIIMGILFVVGVFLPPSFSVLCLFLLIPYAVIGLTYSIYVVKCG